MAKQSYAILSDADSFIYTQDGHKFLSLTFPSVNVTWVMDITTGLWHQRRSFEDAGYPGLGTVFFALFIVEIIFLDIETFIGSSNFSLLIILATLIFSLMMNLPLRYPKLTKFPLLNICICAILIMNLFFFTKLIAVLVLVTILSYAFISPFAFRT